MSVAVVTGQLWLVRHAWLAWLLWAGFALCIFMALREVQWFRRCFWRVISGIVPALPLRADSESPATKIEPENRPPEQALRDRVLQLGRDLFAFLREKGIMPEPKINKSTEEEILQAGADDVGPYVDHIHYGYQGRFKQRVVDLFNELAENGINDPELQQWEIDPPQIQNADRVRKIAEHLFLIAARMDIAKEAKGT